jgi:hypothetical protein
MAYGNELLAAVVLVTCPCHLLYESLENILTSSIESSHNFNWLNIIRPDWFDANNIIRDNVLTFLTMKSLVETRTNPLSIDCLLSLIMNDSQMFSCRLSIGYLIMNDKQCCQLIHRFVQHEHDWSFLHTHSNQVSTKNINTNRVVLVD